LTKRTPPSLPNGLGIDTIGDPATARETAQTGAVVAAVGGCGGVASFVAGQLGVARTFDRPKNQSDEIARIVDGIDFDATTAVVVVLSEELPRPVAALLPVSVLSFLGLRLEVTEDRHAAGGSREVREHMDEQRRRAEQHAYERLASVHPARRVDRLRLDFTHG
jgi:hypothetical protein